MLTLCKISLPMPQIVYLTSLSLSPYFQRYQIAILFNPDLIFSIKSYTLNFPTIPDFSLPSSNLLILTLAPTSPKHPILPPPFSNSIQLHHSSPSFLYPKESSFYYLPTYYPLPPRPLHLYISCLPSPATSSSRSVTSTSIPSPTPA